MDKQFSLGPEMTTGRSPHLSVYITGLLLRTSEQLRARPKKPSVVTDRRSRAGTKPHSAVHSHEPGCQV